MLHAAVDQAAREVANLGLRCVPLRLVGILAWQRVAARADVMRAGPPGPRGPTRSRTCYVTACSHTCSGCPDGLAGRAGPLGQSCGACRRGPPRCATPRHTVLINRPNRCNLIAPSRSVTGESARVPTLPPCNKVRSPLRVSSNFRLCAVRYVSFVKRSDFAARAEESVCE